MSRIRGRDTAPELLIRRGLHTRGLRYRLHDRKLPGRPDLVFARYRTVVFVHGCFWHAHGCRLSKLPAIRPEFWQNKLANNSTRDKAAISALHAEGWRVLVIWECALRGPGRTDHGTIFESAERFIREGRSNLMEILGSRPRSVLTPVRIQRGDAVRAKLAELGLADADVAQAVRWIRGGAAASQGVAEQQPDYPSAAPHVVRKAAARKKVARRK
jgi:DNA mismatch endonuclease, patch repair protein